MDEMNEIKEENDEEKSDLKIVDVYSLSHMTSSSTDAHVSGDCHSHIKIEPRDSTGLLFDNSQLQNIKQESKPEKICVVHDASSAERLIFQDVRSVNSEKVTDDSCSTSDNNRCPVCNKSFVTFDSLKQHVQQEHMDERQHDSTADSLKMDSNKAVKVESEIDNKNNRCSHCNKSYISVTLLNLHIKRMHVNDEQYCCTETSVNLRPDLIQHIYRLPREKQKCDICDYTTWNIHNLKQHFNSVHLNKKPHQCSHCDFCCTQKSKLTQHIRDVHDQMKPYKCSACEKQFTRNTTRNAHYSRVHCGENEKPYSCEQCQSKFVNKRNLAQHQKNIHQGLRDFPCGECGHKFSDKGGLKRHCIAVHDRERPYKCTECMKTFSEKGSLKKHVSNVHEGLKPHTCTECGRKFFRRTHLQYHLKAKHSNEK